MKSEGRRHSAPANIDYRRRDASTGPPRALIVLEIEAGPRVEIETAGGSEPGRLLDWISATPQLSDLFHFAVQLQVEAERRLGRAA
jgi:hypothetical protein